MSQDSDAELFGSELGGEIPSHLEQPSLLEMRSVSMRFGQTGVLRDISLGIPAGSSVAIIGESGCGKSVFLKLLIGLLSPTSGTVHFGGTSLAAMRASDLMRLRTRFGYLFQSGALFDSLSVYENIAFGLRQKNILKVNQIDEVVKSRLTEVGLPLAALHRMPSELSGGQRKRVGLARALAMDPEIMLYDEPTTGLDPIMSDIINELILRVGESHPGMTSLVITHEMKTVFRVADRVIMLQPLALVPEAENQILFDGTVGALRLSPEPRVQEFIRGDASRRIQFSAEIMDPGGPVGGDHP
jgi:phospholipid/cholesterol/gamma-HCH transport system ATP-binding protein